MLWLSVKSNQIVNMWCSTFIKEDEIMTRANQDMQSLIENIHKDEVKRNRKRVAEINNLVDHFRDEIESYDLGGPI